MAQEEQVSSGAERPGMIRSQRFTLFAIVASAVLFSSVKITDYDLWWHLAGGKLVLEHGFPAVNTFSHTYQNYPWSYTQWLFGVMLRLLELSGSYLSISLFTSLAIAVTYFLVYDTARRRSPAICGWIVAPLFLLALIASQFRFTPRPHLITFIGLALMVYLWQRRVRFLPAWFALIALIWGNSHAGVVFGAVVAGLLVIAGFLEKDRQSLRKAGACFAAFLVGSLVNPGFIYPYYYTLSNLWVREILPIAEMKGSTWGDNSLFFILGIVALALIPQRLKKRDFFYALVAVSFFAVAIFAVRIIPKFLILVLPGMALSLQELYDTTSRKRLSQGIVLMVTGSLLVLSGGFFVHLRDTFGWGVDEQLLPRAAARFIKENRLQGAMYNDFENGGYLIWALYPDYRVFMDGRVQAYPPPFLKKFMSAHATSWNDFIGNFPVEFAVINRRYNDHGGELPNFARLFETMGWPLVHYDGSSLVFVRPDGPNAAVAARQRFTFIRYSATRDELIAKAGNNPQLMKAELKRLDPRRLFAEKDCSRFAAAAYFAGEKVLARDFLQAGLARFPSASSLRADLAKLLALEGDRAAALKEFSEVVRREGSSELGTYASTEIRSLNAGQGR